MIVGIGIDLVEVVRVERADRRHGARFLARVFTDGEQRDANVAPERRWEMLAARFAAKEACLKGLGTGWSQGLALRQVEVVREGSGRPTLRLNGAAAQRAETLGVRQAHVSLTHQRSAAAAMVVLES